MTTLSTVSSFSAFASKPSSEPHGKAREGFENLVTDSKPELSGLPFEKSEELSGLPFEQLPIADGLPFEPTPGGIDGLPFEPTPIVDGLPFEPEAPSQDLIATQRLAYLLWSGQIGADGALPSDRDV